jgi:antitoxin VapB
MALSIKNKEVELAAKELSRLMDKPITEAVLIGLQRELQKQRSLSIKALYSDKFARLMQISKECAALPTLDQLTEDEILGYDEFGIPTQ